MTRCEFSLSNLGNCKPLWQNKNTKKIEREGKKKPRVIERKSKCLKRGDKGSYRKKREFFFKSLLLYREHKVHAQCVKWAFGLSTKGSVVSSTTSIGMG